MEHAPPPTEVSRQIAALRIEPARPLIVCDADEVVAEFMSALERYMNRQGLYFTWESYRLNGNIRRTADDSAIERAQVSALIEGFYDACIDSLQPVDGAAAALEALSRRAQIVVLSNLPPGQRARRRRWLDRHGLGYPLVANTGAKGPAVRALAARADAPAFYRDDSAPHPQRVARDAAHVHRLHFVANPRLARLAERAPDCHWRIDGWPAARALIEAELKARGY